MSTVDFSFSELRDSVHQVNYNKACGADDIPSEFWKSMSPKITCLQFDFAFVQYYLDKQISLRIMAHCKNLCMLV